MSAKKSILEDIFRTSPTLISEDDCGENVVIPFLFRLGYKSSQIKRKVTISGVSGRKFKKQADIVVYVGTSPVLVVETKRIQHRLREEDANQVLSYAQLLNPPAPYAVLTNGKQWEIYQLLDETIGDIEDLPEPTDLQAISFRMAGVVIGKQRKEAAERLLVTLENKDQLEVAFSHCRKVLAKEGLIAESAFDELTKILVCKFNEERRASEGLGVYRFTSSWLLGEGPLVGLHQLFTDAKLIFHVFPLNTQIQIRNNKTALEIANNFHSQITLLHVASLSTVLAIKRYEQTQQLNSLSRNKNFTSKGK